MKIKDIVTFVSKSITPQKGVTYNLYSLPSFDEGKTFEVLDGADIQSNKYDVPNKCILFNKLNVRFKRVWRIDSHDENKIASTEFLPLVVDEDVVDFQYCYYLLISDKITNYLCGQNTNTSGSHKRIDPDNFLNIEIKLPKMSIQRQVGKTLSALDRKIVLNKQINDNLEAMAKQLYDYWFVQFDFPNEEGKPYKSNGGVMVWNEKLKREIPQGWSDCVLGDYIGRITNGLNPRKNFVLGSGNNYYVTIRSLVGTTIDWNNCDRCDDEALSKINSRSQLQIGDIIFSAIGTIGRTYYILEEPTNWNISETSFTLRAKENIPNDFFYGMLRSNEIQIKADKAAMGSTLRCLVMDSLCSLQYIEIPSYMMKLFATKVSPLYRQIHRNNKEIAELTKQRDELLPLLMNGQASVNYHLSDD
ncbi:restriction endonuclease subunit S [Bacteroides fragilis]|uniref:restriction endonuclease subunit S n=1 Tax=Bacteroides fragilis TaxID=817 RepID=UPI00202F7B36|nr:restriction endonuclease subunit S [Bacteroides fragilis]MCM0202107.1 restriction endonuclease subunit S [Bacteroides fragilis]